MQYILETPINSLSLGQIGFNLLKASFEAGHDVALFPISGDSNKPLEADFSAYEVEESFGNYIREAVSKRYSFLEKDAPAIRNWHLNGSDLLRTNNQVLLTFHETNYATPVEVSIANLQKKTLFCGNFSEKVFKNFGAENVGSFNVGFDSSFKHEGKTIRASDVSFLLGGKFESRKFTKRLLNLWAKKFGNNKKYSLNCLIFNPFFSPDDNSKLINDALEGKRYWNINFLPRLRTNKEVAALLAACDVDLSAFGGESWGMDAFNMTCLGKWAVSNVSWGQAAWADEANSVTVSTDKLRPAPDGAFFHPNGDFNQGYFPELSDEQIIDALERVEAKAGTVNENGLQLAERMTYSKTLEQILSNF